MKDLPEHLQQAQSAISQWHKEQAIQDCIGKFFTAHSGF